MHFEQRHLSWSISRQRHSPDIIEVIYQISELGFLELIYLALFQLSRAFHPEHPGTCLTEESYLFRSSRYRHCRGPMIGPRCVNSHLGL